MKRMSFLPMRAVVLLLAFTACSEELTEVPSSTLKQIVMTAADFETEDGSRTNFQITSAGAEFSWAANDTVGIFPNEGAQAYFPMTSGAGTKSANFTGGGWALKDASTYAAYYPFIGNFYLNKNAIPIDFTGQVQTGDDSTAHLGAYDYMAAIPATPKNGNVSFAFKHLGALVQLKLTVPQATTLNSVTLTTENDAFAVNGTVDVMASASSITSVTSAKEVTLELKELATTEANQVVTLYMMLPPVDLSAKTLKAVVNTSNGTEEVTLGSKNFQAGKAYALSGSLKGPNGGVVVGNGTYKDGVVSIATAGTMKKLLGDDYLNIASLKIVGPINGDDVYYLRKMLGASSFSEVDRGKLTILDLSEATIVEGGGWYKQGDYYTSNNEFGDMMFFGCSGLQQLYVPDNIISIGHRCFEGCTALNRMYINDLVAWCKIDMADYCWPIGYRADLYLKGVPLVKLTMPQNITEIKSNTFQGCKNIEQLRIHDNITIIGNSAFLGCSSLTFADIGNGVTEIGSNAFCACNALDSVIIGDNVNRICSYAFVATKLKSVTLGSNVRMIDPEAFRDCESLKSIVLGNNVTIIGDAAFENTSIIECYSYSSAPPSIKKGSYSTTGTFYKAIKDKKKAKLYVPARTGTIYRSSNWGDYFENIIEMDD